MIATTTNNSINENPDWIKESCFLLKLISFLKFKNFKTQRNYHWVLKINYKYYPTYIWYAASNNHGNDVAASLFTKVIAPST